MTERRKGERDGERDGEREGEREGGRKRSEKEREKEVFSPSHICRFSLKKWKKYHNL